jgi:hypothetical protein
MRRFAFSACISQIFAKLMKFREEADYNPVSMFTKEDFLLFKGEATGCLDQKSLEKRGGQLPINSRGTPLPRKTLKCKT